MVVALLLRRSSDGHISTTGIFKAAFASAMTAEVESERKYQKTYFYQLREGCRQSLVRTE